MRKPEQQLWDRTRRHLGNIVLMERIENLVGEGTPDTHCIANRQTVWIEHKIGYWPVRERTRIQWSYPLTPQQCNWHREYAQWGGRSYILVGIERELFLIPGALVDTVTAMTRKDIMPWRVTYSDIVKRLYDENERHAASANCIA